MSHAIRDGERILGESRARRGHAHGAFGDAAESHDSFGNHVHVGLYGFVHFVKKFM